MDLEAIYDVPKFHKFTTLAEFDVLRENTDPSRSILINAEVGWQPKKKNP